MWGLQGKGQGRRWQRPAPPGNVCGADGGQGPSRHRDQPLAAGLQRGLQQHPAWPWHSPPGAEEASQAMVYPEGPRISS